MSSKKELIEIYKEYINHNSNKFDNKKGIRVLSYNIQLFRDINNKYSLDKIKKLIDNSNSDIVILYEAVFFKDCKTSFEKTFLKSEYKYIKLCNDKYGINILLSKFPIVNSKIITLIKDPIKKMNRYAIKATININDKELKIIACHLDVFDETEETRKKQILQILNEIDNSYLLLGDLNSLRKSDYTQEEWIEFEYNAIMRDTKANTLVTDLIEKNNFIDCWNFINKNPPKVTVWSMRRVDYMFVGKDFMHKINNCNLLIDSTSDHFPLYMDIDI